MEVFFVKIWVKTQKKYSDGIWYVIMRPGQPADQPIGQSSKLEQDFAKITFLRSSKLAWKCGACTCVWVGRTWQSPEFGAPKWKMFFEKFLNCDSPVSCVSNFSSSSRHTFFAKMQFFRENNISSFLMWPPSSFQVPNSQHYEACFTFSSLALNEMNKLKLI